MNILTQFSCVSLIFFLQLSAIESRQKILYVGLPDEQCTDWKEVTEQEYDKKLAAPIKRYGKTEEEFEENDKCDKPKEDNESCTCMENLGLNPLHADKYKAMENKNERNGKKDSKHSKDKKTDTGSFSEEFDGSEEEPLQKHGAGHKTSGGHGDKQSDDRNKKKLKSKNGKGGHKNDDASFSEEFSGSEEEESMKIRKHKDAKEGENKAEEVKSGEESYEDINEDGGAKSESVSYADSEELPNN